MVKIAPPIEPRSRDHVASLARGLAVICAFDGENKRLTLTEVAQRAQLNKGATRRLLLTLKDIGFVDADGRYFFLTPRVLSLALGYVASLDFWESAQPVLTELSHELDETCAIAVLDADSIVFVARSFPRRRLLSVDVSVGTRLPAHATAMGQVLLSQVLESFEVGGRSVELTRYTDRTISSKGQLLNRLRQVRRQDYSHAVEEYEAGLSSLAVPIRDANGSIMAALNVVAHADRTAPKTTTRYLMLLRRAAKRMSS